MGTEIEVDIPPRREQRRTEFESRRRGLLSRAARDERRGGVQDDVFPCHGPLQDFQCVPGASATGWRRCRRHRIGFIAPPPNAEGRGSMNGRNDFRPHIELLTAALERLRAGFAQLPSAERNDDQQTIAQLLTEVADRLHDNFPYFHPLYAGQMLKPPHPVARLAYELALWINPNNHALDGWRCSSAMEKEAVAELARMIGWGETTHLGHLCGGGTMANLEALWVAGQLNPGKTVLASTQAHYTHRRIASVLGLLFDTVPCDRWGRMEVPALERRLAAGDVGTVVATLGTTATGAVDPLAPMLDLRERYDFRVHADAAYGGYFALVSDLAPETRAAFDRLRDVASIVIDPHKHGLQPYGCGCVIFRDPSVAGLDRHDSPYTYYPSSDPRPR